MDRDPMVDKPLSYESVQRLRKDYGDATAPHAVDIQRLIATILKLRNHAEAALDMAEQEALRTMSALTPADGLSRIIDELSRALDRLP
jgi:hypothetical protein